MLELIGIHSYIILINCLQFGHYTEVWEYFMLQNAILSILGLIRAMRLVTPLISENINKTFCEL